MTPENLSRQLREHQGESTEWPTDGAFGEAWRSIYAYHTLNNPKVVHILKRLNDTYMGSKMEGLSFDMGLTVEHILPQQWIEHWPLPDGCKGLSQMELWTAEPDDPRTQATKRRNAAVQTLGNLTILTQALNSAVSNCAWKDKRPELLRHSLLPLNQQLQGVETWDEDAIDRRSDALLEHAFAVWPRV
jgi:hypothetical protein